MATTNTAGCCSKQFEKETGIRQTIRIMILFLSTCLISAHAHAQDITIKEVKCLPDSQYYNAKDSTIMYPVIITIRPAVDSIINSAIRAVILEEDDSSKSLISALKDKTKSGLINLSYEVTYSSSRLLSLHIDMEGCGAHCSTWSEYFTFDLNTGNLLTIKDFISGQYLPPFGKKVKQDKLNALRKYLNEEKKDYSNKEIDADTWSIIKDLTAECMKEISLEHFSLWGNNLEIIDPCEFPYVIRTYSPGYQLHYTYQTIQNWLAPAYKSLLLKNAVKQ
ncbi:MAG: hypothetical protein JST86_19240 [Bacteroidetes bacterium]|nr:hypothetical protein [Bacteroidota bacterium]